MIVCEKCGEDNPLGRVFCVGCGGKLELKDIGHADVFKANKLTFREKYGGLLVKILVVIVLAPLGVAFWPRQEAIGGAPDTRVASELERQLRGAERSVERGMPVQLAMTDHALNGLVSRRASKIKAKSLSFAVTNQVLYVRLVKEPFGTVKLGTRAVTPSFSFDAACTAADGALRVRSSAVGHLPLVGPFKMLGALPAKGVIAAQEEWSLCKYLQSVALQERTLRIELKKP